MSHALKILEAAIRRHRQVHPDASMRAADLITARADELIPPDLSGELSFDDNRWLVRPIQGELSLRAALTEAPRVILVLPQGFKAPWDIEQRRWLRRSLHPNAQDVVSAATGHYCRPITDPAVSRAVLDDVPGFFARASERPWPGPAVSEKDIVDVLRSGNVKVGRRSAPELLARWLIDGPPEADPLLPITLKESHFEVHDWLLLATTEAGQQQIVTAGALGPIRVGRSCVRFDLPVDADPIWTRLVSLVRQALSVVRREAPERAKALLAPADKLARDLTLDFDEARRLTLLPAAFEQAVSALALRIATDSTPGPDAFDQLSGHLYAEPDVVEALEATARLARFNHAADHLGEDVEGWAQAHMGSIAWADLCARQVRRVLGRLPQAAIEPIRTVLDGYLVARDRQNHAFAEAVAQDEQSAYRSRPLGPAMSLHLVAANVLRPILAQRSALLVVLDGCDVSTFYELIDDLRTHGGVGLGKSPNLSGHAGELPALMPALSPLPTLTEVGRRAIFAGQIPQNDALNDLENAAANAKSDQAAFKRNAALGDVERALFLKGDLGDDCEALIEQLKDGPALIAVVFNGVDDHLSSREVTPHGRWTAEAIHPTLRRVLKAAIQHQRAVILTSDHGHTPYWSAARKTVAPTRSSQRFAQGEAPEGAVTFQGVPWRAGTLHSLTPVGAYVSVQRAGYHGGAALEEVVVPIAQLVQDGQPPSRPEWWAHMVAETSITDEAIVDVIEAVEDDLRQWWQAASPKVRALIQFLDTHGQITEADAARLTQNLRSFRRLGSELDKLKRQGVLPWEWQRNTQGGMARIVKQKGAQ